MGTYKRLGRVLRAPGRFLHCESDNADVYDESPADTDAVRGGADLAS
jgi:hypothetical protein